MPEVGQGKTAEVESTARAQGWVPLSEWKGDPAKHVDAETFVRRGEEIVGLATARSRKLQEEIDSLKSEIQDLRLGNQQFKEYHDRLIAKEAEQRQQLIQQLEAKQAKAITDGDGQTHINTQRQLDQLRAQQNMTIQQRQQEILRQQQTAQEDMVKWVKENPWYTEDSELRLIADGMADRVRSELPQATPKQFLSELARRVKALKPTHPAFENPNREQEPSVTDGDDAPPPRNRRGGKKTFDDLPKDAQEAARRLERTHGISKEDYLANYEW